MTSEEELFASVDALLEEEPQLPPPAERARLREAAGQTQARLAAALKTTTQTVKNWENGRSEPTGARLEAYQRLLHGWAEKYPAHGAPAAVPAPAPVTAPKPQAPASPSVPAAPEPAVVAPVEEPVAEAPAAAERPARPAARPATPRRPATARKRPRCRTSPRPALPARSAGRAGRRRSAYAAGRPGAGLPGHHGGRSWWSGRCASPAWVRRGCTATARTPTR